MLDMKGGSKYQPLHDYLSRSDRPVETLTFAEIEALIKTPLPDSARTNRAWWSNRSKGALQASAWMGAGYTVEAVDFEQQQATFRKPPDIYVVQQIDGVIQWNPELIRALRSHMGMTQAAFAKELEVRQQTVSEWEKGAYQPTRAFSKYLTLVAERAEFRYQSESPTPKESVVSPDGAADVLHSTPDSAGE
jgi:DNA-binding transcriptional regulator YiaG